MTQELPRSQAGSAVLSGLTDARWWIAHQDRGSGGVADALQARLGPHARLLGSGDISAAPGSDGPAGRCVVEPTDEQLVARDLFVAGKSRPMPVLSPR